MYSKKWLYVGKTQPKEGNGENILFKQGTLKIISLTSKLVYSQLLPEMKDITLGQKKLSNIDDIDWNQVYLSIYKSSISLATREF